MIDKKFAAELYTYITGLPVNESKINDQRHALLEVYYSTKLGEILTNVTKSLQVLASKGDSTASAILKQLSNTANPAKAISVLQKGIMYLNRMGISAQNARSMSFESYRNVYYFLTGYKISESSITQDKVRFCESKIKQMTKEAFEYRLLEDDKIQDEEKSIVSNVITFLKDMAAKGNGMARNLFQKMKDAYNEKDPNTFSRYLKQALSWLGTTGLKITDIFKGKNNESTQTNNPPNK